MPKNILKPTIIVAIVAVLAIAMVAIPLINNTKQANAQLESQGKRSSIYWCYNYKPSRGTLGFEATSRPISDMPEKCFPASAYTEYQCDQYRSTDPERVSGQFCYRVTQSR